MYDYEARRIYKKQLIANERATAKAICLYFILAIIAFLCIDRVIYVYSLTYNPVRVTDNEKISFKSVNIDTDAVLDLDIQKKMIANDFSYSISPNEIYNFYKDKGYNDAAIAGILANIEVESNFNSKERAERHDENGNRVGGLGIYQWNGIRTDRLKSWANQNGFNHENPFVQMAFMIKESPFYSVTPDNMNFINSEWGAANAAYHFAASFEKCAPEFIPKRTQKAIKWFNIIKDNQFKSQLQQQLALNINLL